MKTSRLEPLVERCELAAHTLKALAHPQRLQILCYLTSGEKTVGELEALCAGSQSAVSQFLARMRAEGLVAARREGQFVFYRISDPKIFKLIESLRKVFCH
ncbi:MAG: metalloregulator ArsR/SmtB family transcription factor [Pseudomonadota bacterium]